MNLAQGVVEEHIHAFVVLGLSLIHILEAEQAVREKGIFSVPVHLQDRHYGGAAKLGHGQGYQYAHDYPNHYVKQQYLPDGLEGSSFYRPSDNGYEKQIGQWLDFLHREADC